MSPLPTYRVFVTPVRATVPTFQRCGDRAVFDGSAAGWLYPGHSRGAGRITEHALPAWPILGTPVPETGIGAVCGAGSVDHAGCGVEFRVVCLAHVAVHRLDRCPRLSVCRSTVHLLGWPAFLASARRAATLRPATPP